MAAKYKVRKGLETTLKIKGVSLKYFYFQYIILAILILYLVLQFFTLVDKMTGEALFSFIIQAVICTVIFFAGKWYLHHLSNQKQLRFKNTMYTISNKDILDILK